MKAGSLTNLIYTEGKTTIVPEVGMGATLVMWTDRHAYTIIEVSKSGKSFKMQRDKATRIDKNGMSDSQEYSFERDPNGSIDKVTLRRDGKWKVEKQGTTVIPNTRDEYYDYSF